MFFDYFNKIANYVNKFCQMWNDDIRIRNYYMEEANS